MKQTSKSSSIEFIDYSSELAVDFKAINQEWITTMFVMEASDEEILNDPENIVIKTGGKIYFAKHPKLGIVGTCALLKKDGSSYELTKMGVLEKARGLKVGEALLDHVIQQAKKMQVENLYLLTNSSCEAAIHLYLKNGFQHNDEIMQKYASKYERCDVAMRYFD
jgi:N-acetylglutamate synthase-like GNAT family acetyltransferase